MQKCIPKVFGLGLEGLGGGRGGRGGIFVYKYLVVQILQRNKQNKNCSTAEFLMTAVYLVQHVLDLTFFSLLSNRYSCAAFRERHCLCSVRDATVDSF